MDKLYLGDANHATSKYVVENLGITHIANITDSVPLTFKDTHISYLQVVIDDRPGVNITEYFPAFYCFLEKAFANPSKESEFSAGKT